MGELQHPFSHVFAPPQYFARRFAGALAGALTKAFIDAFGGLPAFFASYGRIDNVLPGLSFMIA
jgi:hypothetical protein